MKSNPVILSHTLLGDLNLLDLYYFLIQIIEQMSQSKNSKALEHLIFLKEILEQELNW